MQPFNLNPGPPPGIFNNGELRDTALVNEGVEEQFQPTREATQVPLPPASSLEQNFLSGDIGHDPAHAGFEQNVANRSGGGDESSQPLDVAALRDPVQPADAPTDDLLAKIPNLFRLLDLYQENGSGGLVEKVLIDQSSLRRLLNTLMPGSYDSVSKINFKALDSLQLAIKPLGVYGSKPEIIRFLREINCLNAESQAFLSASVTTPNDLRSGLYLALPLDAVMSEVTTHRAYIVYWPEDSTWDDKAISSVRRNRVTFMRYLSKLTAQIVALISPEQANAIVWTSGTRNTNASGEQMESFEDSRMFSFEVASSVEQEEDATASDGFTLAPDLQKMTAFKESTHTCLVPGEERGGLLVSKHEPAHQECTAINEARYPLALRSMIESKSSPITLGTLSVEQLMILGREGLQKLYPEPFAKYRDEEPRETMRGSVQQKYSSHEGENQKG